MQVLGQCSYTSAVSCRVLFNKTVVALCIIILYKVAYLDPAMMDPNWLGRLSSMRIATAESQSTPKKGK
jgi:hypothetical protein